ncbi:MAG: hypothetical protein L0Z62_05705, partial [Gemmataceae bacterium]|nr:hypothetical protein [Gemmataceae bacterium]
PSGLARHVRPGDEEEADVARADDVVGHELVRQQPLQHRVAAALAEDRSHEARRAAFAQAQRARALQQPSKGAEDFRGWQLQSLDWFLRDWLILAPIALAEAQTGPDGLDRQQLPNEANLQPREGDRVTVAGQEFVWKKHRTSDYAIDFNAFLGRQADRCVAYAVCYLDSDAERTDLELRVGSKDQAKVYLNGREVYRYARPSPQIPDRDAVENVTLRRGTNVLVFKVVNDGGGWQGCLRFVDKQGNPVQNLRVRLAPGSPVP